MAHVRGEKLGARLETRQAVTRAKKKLYLCHASTRRRFGSKPEVRTRSPFVDAIADALGQSGNSNILKPKVPKSAKPARKNTSTFDWKKRIVVDAEESASGGGAGGRPKTEF